jgi:RNA polymerase sigma-70 factor (ECF subfamily)
MAPARRLASAAASRDPDRDGGLKAVSGPRSRFDELYGANAVRIGRLCRWLLSDPGEAEDVTQEVFLKLHRALEEGTEAQAWEPWLTTVALNACRDRRRSAWWRRVWQPGVELDESKLPGLRRDAEQDLLGREEGARIWVAYRALSTRQQEVFALRHLEGWSTDEVARALGMSSGSVKRHLHRAIGHLRRSLGGQE